MEHGVPESDSGLRRRLRNLRNRAMDYALLGAAVSSLCALAAGLFVNQMPASWSDGTWMVAGVGAAIVAYILGGLSSRALARRAKESSSQADDKLAIARMLSRLDGEFLHEVSAISQWGELEVSLAVARQGVVGEEHVEPISVFVTSSVSDLRCSIVVGEPGSGKSTVLRRLATRILMDAQQNGNSRRAIYLQSRTWSPDLSLDSWVKRAASLTYGLDSSTIARWLRTNSCVLVIDDLDELHPSRSEEFVATSNAWLRSSGGVAIFSCRPTEYQHVFHSIRHEQLATLQPVSWMATAELVRRWGASEVSDRDLAVIRRLLSDGADDLASPMLIQTLLSAASKHGGAGEPSSDQADADTVVGLARRLQAEGNLSDAARLYRSIVGHDEQALGSDVSIQLSLLLARSGNLLDARQLLREAVAAKLDSSLRPEASAEAMSSAVESRILEALQGSRALDEAQISATCGLPPSRVARLVDQLLEKGLLEEVSPRSGAQRRVRRVILDVAS